MAPAAAVALAAAVAPAAAVALVAMVAAVYHTWGDALFEFFDLQNQFFLIHGPRPLLF